MRLLYCDPGLINDLGHHAQSCRAIVGETRRRGIETLVFAAAHVDARLQAELGARPHFRVSPYSRTDGDPFCGWLSGFHTAVNQTVEDFRELNAGLRPDDAVYVNSGQAAQFMALIFWLSQSRLPAHAAIEFGVDPGIDFKVTPAGPVVEARDPRVDASAVLYRFASRHLDAALLARLCMATFDPASSAAYQGLMACPVAALPVPRGREIPPRTWRSGDPITVAVLGHQRGEKGYRFVPEIFALLARRFPGERMRFLAHNAQPDFMPAEQAAMRNLAASDSRIVLDERVADAAVWAELLGRADLILCPYEPRRFTSAYSALASEAIANGLPLIVPAGTTLARIASEFGGGATFATWDARAITDATALAVENFATLKRRAESGAEKWAQHHGPAHCVAALLRLLSATA
jgi:glycosyltransferase involved in cell wall biosynthesis